MPELPEVETMRRGVERAVGARIVEIERVKTRARPIQFEPDLRAFRRRAVGQQIAATGRLGKRVLVRLGSGDALVFEPRMTGLVLLADPPTMEHLRFRARLEFEARQMDAPAELMYWDRRGLGSVRLCSPAEISVRYGEEKLGPDALGLEAAVFARQLGASRRAVKVALLDQRAVAGIGNLYASEILHLAGVHPAAPCDRLRAADWQRIAEAAREVLELAIQMEGSTLSDGTYRNALNQQGTYQNLHRVYDRADEVCGRCGKGTIVRVVQAQRSTFFCPKCQPKRRVR